MVSYSYLHSPPQPEAGEGSNSSASQTEPVPATRGEHQEENRDPISQPESIPDIDKLLEEAIALSDKVVTSHERTGYISKSSTINKLTEFKTSLKDLKELLKESLLDVTPALITMNEVHKAITELQKELEEEIIVTLQDTLGRFCTIDIYAKKREFDLLRALIELNIAYISLAKWFEAYQSRLREQLRGGSNTIRQETVKRDSRIRIENNYADGGSRQVNRATGSPDTIVSVSGNLASGNSNQTNIVGGWDDFKKYIL
ncbi:hypothetical protein F5X99DRAFT_414798 [Biscogniauxia marginata]|nr:hypothetical protein F5X99DRAFT_414798 [Biscogniauxia marginata]